ncbi:AAA domain-containing protein [Vibrio vulnificus]
MIGFFIAGAVMVTASVVAWHYNQKTDEEIGRQNRAYAEQDNIRSRFYSASNEESERFSAIQKEQATKQRDLLLKEIENHRGKISEITEAYKELYTIVLTEIQSEITSPYRKSALKREFSQIEDGQLRLVEYERYLESEKSKVERYWANSDYRSLIQLDPAEPLLPFEWLYPGKLVVVDLSDMGKRQAKFNHRLDFNGFESERDKQKALALAYGDEFPMLVTKKGKHDSFYGCVARGISFHDHIRLNHPIDVTVERYLAKQKSYLCDMHDGLQKVMLPEINLSHPSLRCVPGQQLEVYFDSYDTILQHDPAGKPNERGHKPNVTVTEKQLSKIGMDAFELYIEIKSEHLNKVPVESDFYAETTHWMLSNFSYDSNEITLVKGNVQLRCSMTTLKDGLCVNKLSVFETRQTGIDLPFDFVLVTPEIQAQDIFGWQFGVEQLYTFASQAMIDADNTQERIKQVEFFKRWQKVVDYQKRHESERSVEFEAIAERIDKNKYTLSVSESVIANTLDGEQSVITFINQIEQSGYLKKHFSCKLFVWDAEQGKYLSAIEKSRMHQSDFDVNGNSIDITADLYSYKKFDYSSCQKFKLTVTLPNSAIQRQEQALEALFEDRMVEYRLKDIFLSPASYQAEHLTYWQNKEIQWNDSLKPSQEVAIKKALSAKHIAMIQGPPGTGKTTTIVEMLYQLLSHNPNQKILVASQQNTAVDNAITKFKKKYPELVNDAINIVRIGNPDKLDDDIVEDHFDKLYDSFIDERIAQAINNSVVLKGNAQAASYEWLALLKQMKDSTGTHRVSDEFFTTMLADKNLIGATCVGLAARKAGVDHLEFDVAIVDEAGRATVPELLIPLLRSKKAILIGDHHQLPPSIAPVLREDSAKDEMRFLEETFLESSFFEVLFEQLPDVCTATLAEQFRMAPPIGDLVAELFYTKNGQRMLTNGKGDKYDSCEFVSPDCLQWIDVWGRQDKQKGSTSIYNEMEAKAICDYLKNLSTVVIRDLSVAVITPYGAQKRLIRKMLSQQGHGLQIKLGKLTIKVDTVDSFQGSEAELVCYSTVRTFGSLQFLLDKKRLNVACSRAKENLVFFGNKRHLKKQSDNGKSNLFSEIMKRAVVVEWEGNDMVRKRNMKKKIVNRHGNQVMSP